MRIVKHEGRFLIARGKYHVTYFAFYIDGKPQWPKLMRTAGRFATEAEAEQLMIDIRKAAK